MSRRSTPAPEPTWPVTELYTPTHIAAGNVGLLPPEPQLADYLTRTYGVTVVRDPRNRMAVSLADAYRIRDARMAAEAVLHEEYVAKQRHDEALTAWSRARQEYWANHWLDTMRATPIPEGVPGRVEKQMQAARVALSEKVLAAEAAAGIPPVIQSQLRWPPLTVAFRYPEAGERPDDFPYRAPVTEESL